VASKLARRRPVPVGVRYRAKTYQDRLGYELDMIRAVGFSGYFRIVATYPVGKDNGNPGRTRPRFGRGLVVAWSLQDHRPRPVALGAAVRGDSSIRARVDAGLRHRFCQDKRAA